MAIDLRRKADEFMDSICTALIYPAIEPDKATREIIDEFKPRLLSAFCDVASMSYADGVVSGTLGLGSFDDLEKKKDG